MCVSVDHGWVCVRARVQVCLCMCVWSCQGVNFLLQYTYVVLMHARGKYLKLLMSVCIWCEGRGEENFL